MKVKQMTNVRYIIKCSRLTRYSLGNPSDFSDEETFKEGCDLQFAVGNRKTCEAFDGRGIHWSANIGLIASKPCEIGHGEATWFCDLSGNFVGQQPDRLQCVDVDHWTSEANEDITDPSMTTEEISEFILRNIEADTEKNVGPTGGHLKRLVESFSPLLVKRDHEPKNDDKGNFTENMLDSVSILLGLEVGWNEIQEEETRFETSSKLLTTIDDLGFSFSEKINRKACENYDIKFSQVKSKIRCNRCFNALLLSRRKILKSLYGRTLRKRTNASVFLMTTCQGQFVSQRK